MKILKMISRLVLAIYHDRRLLVSLAWQDFKRRFAGSYFGTMWGFITPMLTMIVYWLVFQFGFRSGNVGDIPFVLWFMCGIVPWLFFSEAFSSASNSFLEYSYLVKKVVFNVNILPLVKIASCMFVHFFFLALLAIACCCFGYFPSLYWLQIIYYLLCEVALLFAVSLIFASVMVFFRDLNQIIGIILLVGMWGTPIAWNINAFPESMHFFFKLNPIFYIVEGYRDSFVQQIWFWNKYNQTAYFWLLVLLLFIAGTFFYDRLKQSFADFL